MNNKTSIGKEAQCARLLKALRERGAVCTSDAREELNVMSPAARVMELRRMGYGIKTDLVWIADANGVLHKQALYTLVVDIEVAA